MMRLDPSNRQQMVQDHRQISGIRAPISKEIIVASREMKTAVGPLESQEIIVGPIRQRVVAGNLKATRADKSLSENCCVVGDGAMGVAAIETRVSVLGYAAPQKSQELSNKRQHGFVAGEIEVTHQIQTLKGVVLEALEMGPDFAAPNSADRIRKLARWFLDCTQEAKQSGASLAVRNIRGRVC
jgi:hypothetical protein